MEHSEQLTEELRTRIGERLTEIIGGYSRPESLYEPMRYVLEGQGKRVRPLLALLAAQAFDGPGKPALEVAAALEILHNFTLVHDDIMDEDTRRRGRPTVHQQWDISTGILSGDGLLTLAYRTLLGADVSDETALLQVFTDALMEICEGQAYDKEFEARAQVSLDEYLMMIRKKTGALLSACCEMGGIVAGVNVETRWQLAEFGHALGKAFQIQDDLLEITSTVDVMGKSLGSDLFARKKTYVLIQALAMADGDVREQIEALLGQDAYRQEDFDQLREIITEIGVVEQTWETVHETIDNAREILDRIDGRTAHLRYLTDRLLKRKS